MSNCFFLLLLTYCDDGNIQMHLGPFSRILSNAHPRRRFLLCTHFPPRRMTRVSDTFSPSWTYRQRPIPCSNMLWFLQLSMRPRLAAVRAVSPREARRLPATDGCRSVCRSELQGDTVSRPTGTGLRSSHHHHHHHPPAFSDTWGLHVSAKWPSFTYMRPFHYIYRIHGQVINVLIPLAWS